MAGERGSRTVKGMDVQTSLQPLRRAPGRVVDVALALVVGLAVTVTIPFSSELGARSPDLGAYMLGPLLAGLLLVRRRWPLQVLLASTGAVLVYHVLDYPAVGLVPPIAVALYTAALYGYARWALVIGAGPMLVGNAWRVLGEGDPVFSVLYHAGLEVAVLVAVVLLGETLRTRRAWLVEVGDRLRRVEQDREREAQRRVSEERLRIARELHDVMAHTVTVIAVQAGVARDVLDEDPDQARSALGTIREASREAMAELKATVGVLREGGQETGVAPMPPVPGLHDLDGLVAMAAGAGLKVDTRVEGEPRRLPAAVDLTAYRIVQESLTNVLRHAHATSATVSLGYRPGMLTVAISDDGVGPQDCAATADEGDSANSRTSHGLVGMAERVTAMDGFLDTGPEAGGGFRVEAHLPTSGPSG